MVARECSGSRKPIRVRSREVLTLDHSTIDARIEHATRYIVAIGMRFETDGGAIFRYAPWRGGNPQAWKR